MYVYVYVYVYYSYQNCGLLAAVSCTKVHNETENKYIFVQVVQETGFFK